MADDMLRGSADNLFDNHADPSKVAASWLPYVQSTFTEDDSFLPQRLVAAENNTQPSLELDALGVLDLHQFQNDVTNDHVELPSSQPSKKQKMTEKEPNGQEDEVVVENDDGTYDRERDECQLEVKKKNEQNTSKEKDKAKEKAKEKEKDKEKEKEK